MFSDSRQLVKKYERGDLRKSDWLDKLAFRKMEEIHAVRRLLFVVILSKNIAQEEAKKSKHLFLYIDLPRFDFPVVFSEPVNIASSVLPYILSHRLFLYRKQRISHPLCHHLLH